MRRSGSLHFLLFSVLAVNASARSAAWRSASVTAGGAVVWAFFGLHSAHSLTPCRLHHSSGGGLTFPHSTQIDSGTACSTHQSSADFCGAPRSADALGNFQPTRWPRATTPASKTTATTGGIQDRDRLIVRLPLQKA